MSALDPAAVAAAAEAWLWIPPGADVARTDDFVLVRNPAWHENPVELVRFHPRGDPAAAAADVLDRVRAHGLDQVTWFVRLGDEHADLPFTLGGETVETLDVLALDLTGGVPPGHRSDDVEVRWALDAEAVRDAEVVATTVFGGSVPPEDRLRESADEYAASHAEQRGGLVVGDLEGRPVGAAGLTVEDGVGRLWGGAVLPVARRRGVYGAMVTARLEYAVAAGARMALVKARVESSGPLLRALGFAEFGRELTVRVPC